MSRTFVALSLSLPLLVVLGGQPSTAQTLVRDIEEVVLESSGMPLFQDQPTDRIHLYKYDGAGGFSPIPFQIDRRRRVDLADLCPPIPGGGGNVNNCEIGYAFDANGNPEPGILGTHDEIVFLARDAGPQAPTTSVWKSGNVHDVRYEIRVNDVTMAGEDPVIEGSGWVYAFLFLEPHAFELSDDYYVNWTQNVAPDPERSGQACTTADPSATRGQKSCGLFEGIQANLPGKATLKARYLGHWILNRLWVVPPGGTAGELLDRMKWRAYGQGGQTEQSWSNGGTCPRFRGLKQGPVRTILYAQGSASGPTTTRVDWFYATHIRARVKLRVHAGASQILHYLDYLKPTPAGQIYVESAPISPAPDEIDGRQTAPFPGAWEDWTQVNTSVGRLVYFFRETRPLNGNKTYHYQDSETSTNDPEFEGGAFGNHGEHFADTTNDFQDVACNTPNPDDPTFLWRQLDFSYFVAAPSTSPPTEEAALWADRMARPLRFEVQDQQRAYPVPTPPPPPCRPSLSQSVNPGTGRYLDLAPTFGTPCGIEVDIVLYRALGDGALSYLARVPVGGTYPDYHVYRGQTYRYVARAANSLGVEGPASDPISMTVIDTQPPTAPTQIQVATWSGAVNVSWLQSADWDLRGYNLYLSTSPQGPFAKVNANPITPTPSPTYSATGLQNGLTYYGFVRSVDWGGLESADSEHFSGTPGGP